MNYEDHLFAPIGKVRSTRKLKSTSYYQPLYIWLLETELQTVERLKSHSLYYIDITANGNNTLRFIYFTGNMDIPQATDRVEAVIETKLTDKQFAAFMKANKEV